ncbi:MAG: UDP-N-acetylmuramate dehydrogenase [Acidobacteria bacterium]|nr:UDP-N-acetylmuramate dehydrogenase [Acidobacteriota bacterium]
MTSRSGDDTRSKLQISRNTSLASMTSLELGGAADRFVTIGSVDEVREAVCFARSERLPICVLGFGSNVVIADEGVLGLMIHPAISGFELERERRGRRVQLTASAGESWDDLVAMTVDQSLAGVECLSGIPGSVGAAPIQNIGAYGQEVASVIDRVRVLDLANLEVSWIWHERCGFGYRTSIFRRDPGRYLVLAVSFSLVSGGRAAIRYDELKRTLGVGRTLPPVEDVREAVLELRRSKSMLIEEGDPNRRSVGSFFLNPVVDPRSLRSLEVYARETATSGQTDHVPAFPVADGKFKVPAAWLIERAGFKKGMRRGSVGISTAHSLALVHHGGGTTAELIELAREIRDGVRRETGIELEPEPTFFGFPTANPLADTVES